MNYQELRLNGQKLSRTVEANVRSFTIRLEYPEAINTPVSQKQTTTDVAPVNQVGTSNRNVQNSNH